MAGSVSAGAGASVTVRTAGVKENFRYMDEVGLDANPSLPSPCDEIDAKKGFAASAIFDTHAKQRVSWHLAIDMQKTHPPHAMAVGRTHKHDDFKKHVRVASDAMRVFGHAVRSVHRFRRGITGRGENDIKVKLAPVVTYVSRLRSRTDPEKTIGFGLHAFFHRERLSDEDAEHHKKLADEKLPAIQRQKLLAEIAEFKKQRIPARAVDCYLRHNDDVLATTGQRKPSFTRLTMQAGGVPGVACDERAAASARAAKHANLDIVTRARWNEACRWMHNDAAREDDKSCEEEYNLPLEDFACPANPNNVFSVKMFQDACVRMDALEDWTLDEFDVAPEHPDWSHYARVCEIKDEKYVFKRRCWTSSTDAKVFTPVFPLRGTDTWRVAPENLVPGTLELCYFPWIARPRVSEETIAFKDQYQKHYLTERTLAGLPPVGSFDERCDKRARVRAQRDLAPTLVNDKGNDDLDGARIQSRRIMTEWKTETDREIAAWVANCMRLSRSEVADIKGSFAKPDGSIDLQGEAAEVKRRMDRRRPKDLERLQHEFKVRARHRLDAQKRACAVLARCLHQDADAPDAVIAIVKFLDEWRITHRNFSITHKAISQNLTWFGEFVAFVNASHEAFFNEFTSHRGATIADFAMMSTYLMRKMNLLPVFWGEQGSGKSFLLTCAQERWIANSWREHQERSAASHKIANNKSTHLMIHLNEEMDPEDVGAGMSGPKGMSETGQSKRACAIRNQETSGKTIFEIKDKMAEGEPWQITQVTMETHIGKLECTNMNPAMIPPNSADRKYFHYVEKRNRGDRTLTEQLSRKMADHLIPAKAAGIEFQQRNQGITFLVGQMIDFWIIKDVDESVAEQYYNRLLTSAGACGIQKTDSVRDKQRLHLVSSTCCVLDKLTQLLDNPLNFDPSKEMNLEQLVEYLVKIEPLLVVEAEHVAFAWSLMSGQYDDPMNKIVIDAIINWRSAEAAAEAEAEAENAKKPGYESKPRNVPLLDHKGRPYEILGKNHNLDISLKREEREQKANELKLVGDKLVAQKVKKTTRKLELKEKGLSKRSVKEVLEIEDEAEAAYADEYLRDAEEARAAHVMPGGSGKAAAKSKPKPKAAAAAAAKNAEPARQVLNDKGIEEHISEFLEFDWEEGRDPSVRARVLAHKLYTHVPRTEKVALEALTNGCYSLLRMIILLPNGAPALACNVSKDASGVRGKMRIARVLVETNVPNKTQTFLEHMLMSPFMTRQEFVFGYPHHDQPHLWMTWRNDADTKRDLPQDDRKTWLTRHSRELKERRLDEDAVQSTKLLATFNKRYGKERVSAVINAKKPMPSLDPTIKDINYQIVQLHAIATKRELSDATLWRNNRYIDPQTRRVANKFAPSGAASSTAALVEEVQYMTILSNPEEMAIHERLVATFWSPDRLRDLVTPTAVERQYLAALEAKVERKFAPAVRAALENALDAERKIAAFDEVDRKILINDMQAAKNARAAYEEVLIEKDLAIAEQVGAPKAQFDETRLAIARAWLKPAHRQVLLWSAFDRRTLDDYPQFKILQDDQLDMKQRKDAKKVENRLKFSTDSRIHASMRIMDPEHAMELDISGVFKETQDAYRASAEGKRVSGKREDGRSLPLPNRVIEQFAIEEPRRDMFDLFRHYKDGVFISQITTPVLRDAPEVKRLGAPAPAAAAAASSGKSPARRRDRSVSKSPARNSYGKRARSVSKSPARPATKRSRLVADSPSPAGKSPAKSKRRPMLFSGFAAAAPAMVEAGEGLGPGLGLGAAAAVPEADDADKENMPPPPPLLVAPEFKISPGMQKLAERQAQEAKDRAARKLAIVEEQAAEQAQLDNLHRMEEEADEEFKEPAPMDERGESDLDEDDSEAVLDLDDLGDEAKLRAKGAGHLGVDAVPLKSKYFETEAGKSGSKVADAGDGELAEDGAAEVDHGHSDDESEEISAAERQQARQLARQRLARKQAKDKAKAAAAAAEPKQKKKRRLQRLAGSDDDNDAEMPQAAAAAAPAAAEDQDAPMPQAPAAAAAAAAETEEDVERAKYQQRMDEFKAAAAARSADELTDKEQVRFEKLGAEGYAKWALGKAAMSFEEYKAHQTKKARKAKKKTAEAADEEPRVSSQGAGAGSGSGSAS